MFLLTQIQTSKQDTHVCDDTITNNEQLYGTHMFVTTQIQTTNRCDRTHVFLTTQIQTKKFIEDTRVCDETKTNNKQITGHTCLPQYNNAPHVRDDTKTKNEQI